MGDSEKEEVLIRPEKSMCYVNTIHYRVQVRLYQTRFLGLFNSCFYKRRLAKRSISERRRVIGIDVEKK